MSERPNETYLYDGVYASFDGFQIKLRTQRAAGDHVIYLEPRTLRDLENYIAALRAQGLLE
jgi:hypothetical protein